MFCIFLFFFLLRLLGVFFSFCIPSLSNCLFLSFIHSFFFLLSYIFQFDFVASIAHTHFSYRDIHQRSFEVKNIWILNLKAYNNFTTILAIVSYCFMLPMRKALEHIRSLYHFVISELLYRELSMDSILFRYLVEK